MKIEFKKDGTHESVKELLESCIVNSSNKQNVSDILFDAKYNQIEDILLVLLDHIEDLQHYRDTTVGLRVTDNGKDFFNLKY